jgi:hypothetical protein
MVGVCDAKIAAASKTLDSLLVTQAEPLAAAFFETVTTTAAPGEYAPSKKDAMRDAFESVIERVVVRRVKPRKPGKPWEPLADRVEVTFKKGIAVPGRVKVARAA